MIKKLELKHLKGYLGTGVKILWRGVIFPLDILNANKKNRDYKLILHPLSDLTKPCLEGEKVPIVELAKMIDGEFKKLLAIKNIDGLFGCRYVDDNSDVVVFAFHKNINSFGMHLEFDYNQLVIVSNQLELFEKLFEWHFDVYGLIESGLAIDINTL